MMNNEELIVILEKTEEETILERNEEFCFECLALIDSAAGLNSTTEE